MDHTRLARRILVLAAVALLSVVAAPRAQAQSSEWLEVCPVEVSGTGPCPQSSGSVSIQANASGRYYIRLKQQPKHYDREGNLRDADDNIVETIAEAAPADGWWVRIRVDGVVRYDGNYNADGNDATGVERDGVQGIDITWIPSVGWEFDSDDGNWNRWRGINVNAHGDLTTAVVFSHEVWSNDTHCPEHGVGRVPVSVTDPPPINEADPGVTVSPTSLTVDEGDTNGDTYTVVLTSAPSDDVTVAIAGHSGTDVRVDPSSLTFTTGNWNQAKTVRVTAVDDSDADTDPPVTLTNTANGGGYSSVRGDDVTVTITEKDSPGLMVSRRSLTVTEGDTNGETYQVKLDTQPSADVTVRISGHANTDVRVNPNTLTFTDTDWNDGQDVTVTVVDDVDAEDDADVTLSHTADGGGYDNVAGDDVLVTIDDDDTASDRFTLTVNPTEVSEGVGSAGRSVTVTAELNNAPRTADTEVTVSVGPGTASSSDFDAVNDFTLTISKNQMFGTANFNLKPVDDMVDEGDETVRVSGSASGLTMNSAPGVTILDDDTRGIELSRNALTVREGESGDYTVRLATQPTGDVTITISGHAGSDLTIDDTTLDFTDKNWDQAQTVTVTAGTDTDSIQDPGIVLTHTGSGGDYGGETATLTVTITDTSRVADKVLLSVDPARVSEGVGSGGQTVTVEGQLNGASRTTATTVTVSVAAATAQAEDFTAVTDFTLTIGANQPSGTATFRLRPVNDTLDEDDETLAVSGTTTASGLTVDSATLTIVDDDGAPSGIELSVSPGTLREDVGQMDVQVTARLVGGGTLLQDTVVNLAVEAGTAMLDTDYMATDPGTITILQGELSGTGTFMLTPVDDELDESNETVLVTGTDTASSPALTVHPATITIEDNDGGSGGNGGGGGRGGGATTRTSIELRPNNAHGREDSGSMEFSVELSTVSFYPVSVRWETADGTAESGDDYIADRGRLTISAGQQSGVVRIRLLNDQVPEHPETFTVEFSAPEGATLSADEAIGTIDDDDAVSELTVEDASALEGAGEIRFTASLSAVSSHPVSVQWKTADGTAQSGDDYVADRGTLTIPAGQQSGVIRIRLRNDRVHEPRETFAILFSAPEGATLADDEAIGTIDDDDPVPALTVDDASALEDAGELVFTVNLSNGNSSPVSVDWETADGTAKSTTDYAEAARTLIIPAGQTSGTIAIRVDDDSLHERDETFAVRISEPSGATLADDEAVGTILDDDPVPELQVPDANAAENAREIVFVAQLSAPSALPVTVRWRTADDGATAGADYTASEGMLRIPAGLRDARVAVPLLDDRLDEADEEFAIELSEPAGVALANTRAVGTILDDDAEPALLIGDAKASEGEGRLGFFVWLGSDSGRTVTVDYATREGSATEGTDYGSTSGTLQLPPGSTGETIWVTIVDDLLHENPETLELVLTDPEFAAPGNLVATGTIKDDDAEPGVRIADVSASERAGAMTFVATLEVVAGRTLSWEFQTWDGSAVAGEDYEHRTGSLAFEAGQTRQTIAVPIVDDTLDEVEENFRVILRNPRDSAPPVPQPTGTILDDDDNAIVADAWISRFGRTVATQVVDAVGGRFASMGGPGGSHFLLGMNPFATFGGLASTRGNARWDSLWGETSSGRPGNVSLGTHPGRILSGTSFAYQSEEGESAGGGFDGRWTAWGRGSFLEFDGLDPGVGVTGEVFNVTTGFDYESGALIAGLALAGSIGTGDYHVASTEIQSERLGGIWSILGSAHPYAQVSVAEWLRVWGLGGIGSGTLRISGSEQDADLRMRMWAFGSRSDLQVPALNSLRFALKSDVFWVEMESDPTDTRRGSTAEAGRMRLMLESTFRVFSFWGGEFTPLVEAGVRDDRGDAETGRGVEVASGFRYRNRGLFVEATARSLVSHEDEIYREWGVGGALRLDPGPDYEGLAVQINSSHGAAASTVQRLWSDPGTVTLSPGMLQGRHEAEVGYGFRALRGGAMVIPFSGFAYSPSGAKSFRLGSRLRLGSRWVLSLQADRNRYGFREPWYGVVLRGHLLPERWRRPAPGGKSR